MKMQQRGFTLIELIMVIAVLGILAAFALPKFADLSNDARKAALNGAGAAVRSASGIVHAGWLAKGNNPATVTLEGSSIAITFGYADADDIATAAQISSADFTIATAAGVTTITGIGATTPASCVVSYTEAANASTPPVIAVTTTGC